jgi:predicted nucleic acid-binding protein
MRRLAGEFYAGRGQSASAETERDSAILAAALALGCDRVYSEDLSRGLVVEGLTIIGPFR